MYARTFVAGWGDMDFNSHMRNTAFLDHAADVRLMFFADNGFSAEEFAKRRFGPVIRKDELEYFREVALLQEISIHLAVGGLAPDGSRFIIRNDVFHMDGTLCARVTSAGGWLDLAARKLIAPPEALVTALRSLPRTETYTDLPSSVRNGR
jgi:acyl-CoA thioester hydrolase